MVDEGEIVISVKEAPDRAGDILITVSDNGVGMTAVPFEYSSPSDAQVAYAVYDRQNRQVTSNSQSVGSGRGEVRFLWSGNFQGRRCPSGYYLIQYSITDSSGATELHSQEVYLEIPQR